MGELITLMVGAVLVNNFVLVKFLGLCPFMGVSKKTDGAVGMALATGVVLTLASAMAWVLEHWMLQPLGMTHLRTLAFIVVIAATVQLTELLLHRQSPRIYAVLGLYLPLITTNCAVLGVALLNVQAKHTLLEAVLYGFAAAVGFGLVLVLFAGLRERLVDADVPAAFRGAPIALVTAGIMALAFQGFAGMDR